MFNSKASDLGDEEQSGVISGCITVVRQYGICSSGIYFKQYQELVGERVFNPPSDTPLALVVTQMKSNNMPASPTVTISAQETSMAVAAVAGDASVATIPPNIFFAFLPPPVSMTPASCDGHNIDGDCEKTAKDRELTSSSCDATGYEKVSQGNSGCLTDTHEAGTARKEVSHEGVAKGAIALANCELSY